MEESQKEIQKYSNEKGFKPLSTDLLSRCFKVPAEGVDIVQNDIKAKLIPESLLNIVRQTINFDKIGTITPAFGVGEIYTFIYIDGNTYITQSKEVINQLLQNGFKHSSLIPPLMFTKSTNFEDKKLQEIYDKTIITDEEYYDRTSKKKLDIYQTQIEYWKKIAEELRIENDKLKKSSSNVDIENNTDEFQSNGPKLS